MIINFVIGLPGSGKSRYLKDKEFVVDDLINPQFPECNILWVADPRFCDPDFLAKTLENLENIYGPFRVEMIYFENNLKKCRQNIEHRRLHVDDRKVEGLLRRLSRIYEPINPIEIESEFVL